MSTNLEKNYREENFARLYSDDMNYLPNKDNLIDIPFSYHNDSKFNQETDYQNEFCRPYWYNDKLCYNEDYPKYNNYSYLYNNNSLDGFCNRNFDDVKAIY